MEHERDRAEQLGALPELAGDDLHVLGRARNGSQSDCLSERVEQHVSGDGHAAPNDDPLGVDEVAEIGDRGADVAPGVREGAPAAGVAVDGAREHVVERSAAPRGCG